MGKENMAEDLFVMVTLLLSGMPKKNQITLFTPNCTKKYYLAVAEVSEKVCFSSACIFFRHFCTYVFIYYASLTK